MQVGKFLIIAGVVAFFVWNFSNGSKTTVHSEVPEWLRGTWYQVEKEFDDPGTGVKSIRFFSQGFEQLSLEDRKEFTYRHRVEKVKVIAPEDMLNGEVDIYYNPRKRNRPNETHVLNVAFSSEKESVIISTVTPSGMNDGAGGLPEENWYTLGEFSPSK